MSSSSVENSGRFTSTGSQWVGNSIHTNRGNIYIDTSKSVSNTNTLRPGLYLGDAPAIGSDLFIGRDSELKAIHDVLNPSDPLPEQRRIILGGLGGVGKTQLAIAYARQYHHIYDFIFWLDASSESSLQASLRQIGKIVTTDNLNKINIEQLMVYAHNWLTNPSNANWLLIFDNYDDPQAYNIEKHCPYAAQGFIIVTSRVPDLVRMRASRQRVQSLNDVTESLQILQTRSQRPNVNRDPHARQLAERLAGLPLALATAGAYLRKTTMPFEQYLQLYEEHFNINPRRPLQLQEYANHTLYNTWNITHRHLEEIDQHAAKMLKLLAYFDNREIWIELLQAGVEEVTIPWLKKVAGDRIELENVMSMLVDYCLLEISTNSLSYSLHNCVHDWALNELNSMINDELYWYAFDCIYNNLVEDGHKLLEHSTNIRWSQHTVRLMHPRFDTCGKQDDGLLTRLEQFHVITRLLHAQIMPLEAEKMYLRILASCENSSATDKIEYFDVMRDLGRLYLSQYRSEGAGKMLLTAFEGRCKLLGYEHIDINEDIYDLASSFRSQGMLLKAESILLKRLDLSTEQSHQHAGSVAMLHHALGCVYQSQSKLSEAEKMFSEAIALKEKVLGLEDPLTLDSIHALANICVNQGRYAQAEQMYIRVIEGNERIYGPNHHSTARTDFDFGVMCAMQERFPEAERYYLRALSGITNRLEGLSDIHAHVRFGLGDLYAAQNRLDDSEQAYLQSIAGFELMTKPTHKPALSAKQGLARTLQKQGKLDQAMRIYEQLITLHDTKPDVDVPYVPWMMLQLGEFCEAQGQSTQANEWHQRALACRDQEKVQNRVDTETDEEEDDSEEYVDAKETATIEIEQALSQHHLS